ncbi:Acetate-CoA ligase [Coxiella burnetii str. Namibia]|nr:Acetate-CoA ligase [Coxiella burnetii str. Namibia]
MQRILRRIVNGETENLGDISTLANPETVQNIITLCYEK